MFARLLEGFVMIGEIRKSSRAPNAIRDRGHHDVRAEEERGTNEQRRLVVQQMSQPASRNDLGNDDRHQVRLATGRETIDVLDERSKDRPIR